MTKEEYKQIMSMFSDNAKTYTQVSIAALILPITFIRQVLGVTAEKPIKDYLSWPLIASWLIFLIAIASGLLYQYIAVKLVEACFEKSDNFYGGMKWFIDRPEKVYATMMISFYVAAFLFVIAAWVRFYKIV
jgi:energy-coupling factor transporter transmembrane protein EcfT